MDDLLEFEGNEEESSKSVAEVSHLSALLEESQAPHTGLEERSKAEETRELDRDLEERSKTQAEVSDEKAAELQEAEESADEDLDESYSKLLEETLWEVSRLSALLEETRELHKNLEEKFQRQAKIFEQKVAELQEESSKSMAEVSRLSALLEAEVSRLSALLEETRELHRDLEERSKTQAKIFEQKVAELQEESSKSMAEVSRLSALLEENKWKKPFEIAKKQAFSEGVLEAQDYGDGVYWVQCEDKRWLEVQEEYYCPLCNKHLNQSSLEAHINSDAHKKKVASSGSGPGMAEWQTMGPDGLVRCIPCNKVVDDKHISSGDHIRRLNSWLAHEQRKKTGYAAPTLEYLAYVPSVVGDDTSQRWLKCLLCGKFVQDKTYHSGTKENPQGSVQHKKNLTNYVGTAWYQENVIKERQKWHPAPTASPAPWAAAPAPASYCGGRAPAAPAANAQPAWMRDDWVDTKTTQVPYPSSSETGLPSADAAAEGEGEEFEC